MITGGGMRRWINFVTGSVSALAVVFAAAVDAASGQDNLERGRLQQQMQLLSEAPADDDSALDGARKVRRDAPEGSARQGVPEQDPLLEQTRQRIEQQLKAQRELSEGFAADPDTAHRDMRFGVGYEMRMRNRRELGFDSAGGFGAGGPGAGSAAGFGGGRR